MKWAGGGRFVRTGIDLGTGSVKLVRGVGGSSLEQVTHVGIEEWDPPGEQLEEARASAALSRLLARLKLRRAALGRIAVGVGGDQVSLREVSLPKLSEREMRRALPYEAKKHLSTEAMESPCLDFQILGPAPASDDGSTEEMRVLLVAAPRALRNFPIRVLGRAGLEPEVIDLEALAGLNALHALGPPKAAASDGALGYLDLGGAQAALHVVHPDGGFVVRTVGPGADSGARDGRSAYVSELATRIRETITFFRGRHRRGMAEIRVAGGGALIAGLPGELAKSLEIPVEVVDPLKGLAEKARGVESVAASAARLVTACGLCRWWGEARV